MFKHLKSQLYSLCLLAAASSMSGAIASPLYVGQSADFSGGQAPQTKDFTDAARAVLEQVNRNGGVDGRKVELVSMDDRYDPAMAAVNTRDLIVKHQVVALLGYRGTPQTEAAAKIASQYGVPMFAPVTGANSLRSSPLIYHIRASYTDEIDAMVRLFAGSRSKVGVFYRDDTFGAPLRERLEFGLKLANPEAKLTYVARYTDRTLDADIQKAASMFKSDPPQVVVMIATQKPATEFLKATRSLSPGTQFFQMSSVDPDMLRDTLGEAAVGVGVTTILPYPRVAATPMIYEFQALARKNQFPMSYKAFEGYVAAKVLVEALRRASPKPTAEKVAVALRGQTLNFGDYSIDYRNNMVGSNYVEVVGVGRERLYLR